MAINKTITFGGTVKGRGGIGFFVAFPDIPTALRYQRLWSTMLKDDGYPVQKQTGYYDKKGDEP